MSAASAAIRDRNRAEVVAAIPVGLHLTARKVWRRVGMWAPLTVRGMLVEAVARGEATRVMRDGAWLYARVAADQPGGDA